MSCAAFPLRAAGTDEAGAHAGPVKCRPPDRRHPSSPCQAGPALYPEARSAPLSLPSAAEAWRLAFPPKKARAPAPCRHLLLRRPSRACSFLSLRAAPAPRRLKGRSLGPPSTAEGGWLSHRPGGGGGEAPPLSFFHLVACGSGLAAPPLAGPPRKGLVVEACTLVGRRSSELRWREKAR